ncbi:hypothetical protein HDV03_001230 [Kappamyces sp. JEL0829]|nr:hypothetical protein HDV03_001230 [Kappamyces sp. JEL0829]
MPAPRTACHCGIKKWRRGPIEGTWVCLYGHEFQGQEEVGDDEALLGTQTRTISIRGSRRSSSKKSRSASSEKLPNDYVLLQFQQNLLTQDLTRDLWLLWLQQMGKAPIAAQGTRRSYVLYPSHLVTPRHTLMFIHLAAFIMKIDMTLGDLYRLVCGSEGFPYFDPISKTKLAILNAGGYDSFPAPLEMQGEIVTLLNHLYLAGLTIRTAMEQPSLAFRLLKTLELPVELYVYYKTVSKLKGARVLENENIFKAITHTAVCCLWVANVYHHPQVLVQKQTAASYLFSSSIETCCVQDSETPFLENGAPITEQKKVGVDKIASNLYLESIAAHRQDAGRQARGEEANVGIQLAKQMQQATFDFCLQTNASTDPFPPRSFELKSYFQEDLGGNRDPVLRFLLLKTSALLGMDPYPLHDELRKLDILLYTTSTAVA